MVSVYSLVVGYFPHMTLPESFMKIYTKFVEFIPIDVPQQHQARHQYGLHPNSTSTECFNAFMQYYGAWLHARANTLAATQRLEVDDVMQQLLMQVWIGASHPGYEPQLGKSRIGFIYQRCCWFISRMWVKPDPERLLGERVYPDDDEEYRHFEDYTPAPGGDILGGSRQLTRVGQQVENRELINKILSLASKMPYNLGQPLMELLNPSEEFIDFVERLAITQTGSKQYANAAKYEFCGSTVLFNFTHTRAKHLQAALAMVRKNLRLEDEDLEL